RTLRVARLGEALAGRRSVVPDGARRAVRVGSHADRVAELHDRTAIAVVRGPGAGGRAARIAARDERGPRGVHRLGERLRARARADEDVDTGTGQRIERERDLERVRRSEPSLERTRSPR